MQLSRNGEKFSATQISHQNTAYHTQIPMFAANSCVYAANYQARVLCSQKASHEKHRFLIGTCCVNETNELSVLEYHENLNQIEAAVVYNHPDQIWSMEPSPSELDRVLTSHQSSSGKTAVSLWRMPHQTEEDLESGVTIEDKLELNQEATLVNTDHPSSVVQSLKWHPTKANQVLAADTQSVRVITLADGRMETTSTYTYDHTHNEDSNVMWNLTSGIVAWDPHTSAGCATARGTTLHLLDTRKMKSTQDIPHAHDGSIRDVEYNPNKPSILVTCGDDRKVKFWDIRNLSSPVRTLAGHSHYAWCVRFNPFHDQLLLSGGSDNLVNLWRVASCSSAPWIGTDESADGGGVGMDASDPPDVKVRVIDQHEDSVYGVAWSPADAWMYCSLSYDGTVILNHVPSTEKYKILL